MEIKNSIIMSEKTIEIPKNLDDFVRTKIGKGLQWVLDKKRFTLNKKISATILVTPEKPWASTIATCSISQGVRIEIMGSYTLGFQELGYTNRFHFKIKGLEIEPDTFCDKRTNVFEAEFADVIKAIA